MHCLLWSLIQALQLVLLLICYCCWVEQTCYLGLSKVGRTLHYPEESLERVYFNPVGGDIWSCVQMYKEHTTMAVAALVVLAKD